MAWVRQVFRGENPLQLCEVEAGTGACEPLEVMRGVADDAPKLQGNRLVWDARVGDQASDVFFCEYDSILGECPVQRLTAHVARQAASDIDADIVVFEDDRAGPTQVRGIRLPTLRKLRNRKTRAGRWLRVPVRARHAGLELAVESAGGETLADLGARFVGHGPSRGVFLWRPRPAIYSRSAGRRSPGWSPVRRSASTSRRASGGRVIGSSYEASGAGSRIGVLDR